MTDYNQEPNHDVSQDVEEGASRAQDAIDKISDAKDLYNNIKSDGFKDGLKNFTDDKYGISDKVDAAKDFFSKNQHDANKFNNVKKAKGSAQPTDSGSGHANLSAAKNGNEVKAAEEAGKKGVEKAAEKEAAKKVAEEAGKKATAEAGAAAAKAGAAAAEAGTAAAAGAATAGIGAVVVAAIDVLKDEKKRTAALIMALLPSIKIAIFLILPLLFFPLLIGFALTSMTGFDEDAQKTDFVAYYENACNIKGDIADDVDAQNCDFKDVSDLSEKQIAEQLSQYSPEEQRKGMTIVLAQKTIEQYNDILLHDIVYVESFKETYPRVFVDGLKVYTYGNGQGNEFYTKLNTEIGSRSETPNKNPLDSDFLYYNKNDENSKLRLSTQLNDNSQKGAFSNTQAASVLSSFTIANGDALPPSLMNGDDTVGYFTEYISLLDEAKEDFFTYSMDSKEQLQYITLEENQLYWQEHTELKPVYDFGKCNLNTGSTRYIDESHCEILTYEPSKYYTLESNPVTISFEARTISFDRSISGLRTDLINAKMLELAYFDIAEGKDNNPDEQKDIRYQRYILDDFKEETGLNFGRPAFGSGDYHNETALDSGLTHDEIMSGKCSGGLNGGCSLDKFGSAVEQFGKDLTKAIDILGWFKSEYAFNFDDVKDDFDCVHLRQNNLEKFNKYISDKAFYRWQPFYFYACKSEKDQDEYHAPGPWEKCPECGAGIQTKNKNFLEASKEGILKGLMWVDELFTDKEGPEDHPWLGSWLQDVKKVTTYKFEPIVEHPDDTSVQATEIEDIWEGDEYKSELKGKALNEKYSVPDLENLDEDGNPGTKYEYYTFGKKQTGYMKDMVDAFKDWDTSVLFPWAHFANLGEINLGALNLSPEEVRAMVNSWFEAGYQASHQGQCTFYALGLFNELYRTNIMGLPNGKDCAFFIANQMGWDTPTLSPSPGALFSVEGCSKNVYGHVGMVLSVTEDTITVWHGNFDGEDNTISDWETAYKGGPDAAVQVYHKAPDGFYYMNYGGPDGKCLLTFANPPEGLLSY